jgi:hypothetical protein
LRERPVRESTLDLQALWKRKSCLFESAGGRRMKRIKNREESELNTSKEKILNGWISPEGEIFSCGLMGHRELSYKIGEIKGFDVFEFYIDLWNRGYLRFSGNPNCFDPAISFDEAHLNRFTGETVITEAQKMAQAWLLKQLYKSRKTKAY